MDVKKILVALLPFLYIWFFIFEPIIRFDTDYGWSVIIYFWIPNILLFGYLFKWMRRQNYLKPFFIVNILMAVSAFYIEFAALGLRIWGFDETRQSLWGLKIWDAPIEEFVFWFGATPFTMLVYLYFYKLIVDPAPPDEEMAWPIIAIPFIVGSLILHKKLKNERVISWKSLILLTLVFEIMLFMVEHISVIKRHWVYVDERILRLRFFEVPIEEMTIYYILGPVFCVFIYHFFELDPKVDFARSKRKNIVT